MKNIRQLYNELEEQHKKLSNDYLELQRLLKRIVLTAKYTNGADTIHADLYIIKNYSDETLDRKKLKLVENIGMKRIEIWLDS